MLYYLERICIFVLRVFKEVENHINLSISDLSFMAANVYQYALVSVT